MCDFAAAFVAMLFGQRALLVMMETDIKVADGGDDTVEAERTHSDVSGTSITADFTNGMHFCVGIVAHYPFHAVKTSMRCEPMGAIEPRFSFSCLFLVKPALISSS